MRLIISKVINDMAYKGIQGIKFLIEINFYISVIVVIAAGIFSLPGSDSIFEFNEDLYGALDNNLRMVMIYLAITEMVILVYSFYRKIFQIMIFVGFFLILMIGSMEFYAEVNTIEIDENFPLFFLYTGLSHILFGVMVSIKKDSLEITPDKTS